MLRTALLLSLIAATPLAAGDRPPNVVLILADDLGYGDPGCYGQKVIRTPHIDALAKGGVRFTSGYAGATVCAPSRCALMTGLHTGHAQVRGNGEARVTSLKPGTVTVAALLKLKGYRTAVVGKWGLGELGPGESGMPANQGFDEFYGYLSHKHAHNYYPTHLFRHGERVPLKNVVPDEGESGQGRATVKAEYAADKILDEAVAFVTRQAETPEQPFFLYYAPTLPHANNEARQEGLEVPSLGEYENMDLPPAAKAYAAMVTHLDAGVGRIVETLKSHKLDRDTLIVLTSDNGPHKEGGYHPDLLDSNGPLRGIKRDLTDGGIRVPMIAAWPGRIDTGRVSDAPVAAWDVLPTLAELAGVSVPAKCDGVSLVPILKGEKSLTRTQPLYWEFHERGFDQAVRMGDFKAVKVNGGPTQIYNVTQDIGEATDLADSRPELVERAEGYFKTLRDDSPDWPVRFRKSPTPKK